MILVSTTLASVVDTAVNSKVNSEGILLLIQAQKLSENELSKLRDSLNKKTLKELQSLAKSVSVRLTGSSCKHNIIDCLITMGKIGVVRDPERLQLVTSPKK